MDDVARALAAERAGYMRAGRPERCISVDEQLALRGYCVTKDGDLVKLAERERPVKEKAPRGTKETAAVTKPPEKAV